jgi:hypothetical protein
MDDRLPDISIKMDTSPDEFLNRLKKIALKTRNFEIKSEKDIEYLIGQSILGLKPKEESIHRGLFGQIIVTESSERASIELRALRWNPDPPTYDIYVKTAKDIFEPLLREYNKQYKTNRYLNIQSKKDTEPKLPHHANKIFNRFVRCANLWGANIRNLHPRDWQRFYDFVKHCFARRVKITEDDVERLLIASGFSDNYASHIANIFHHGINLLKRCQ